MNYKILKEKNLSLQSSRAVKKIKKFFLAPFRFAKNIWIFRKDLWSFRSYDYSCNLSIFLTSLEMTADFLESPYSFTASAKEEAAKIREFIRLIRIAECPFDETERLSGISFEEAYPPSGMSETNLKSEKFIAYNEKMKHVELEYWERGMEILKKDLRSWWD